MLDCVLNMLHVKQTFQGFQNWSTSSITFCQHFTQNKHFLAGKTIETSVRLITLMAPQANILH